MTKKKFWSKDVNYLKTCGDYPKLSDNRRIFAPSITKTKKRDMKKLLFTIAMLLTISAASAQDAADTTTTKTATAQQQVIPMNRTFSVGGKALMCLRSKTATKNDMKALTWTLSNDRIADKNIVVLDVKDARTDRTEAHQLWDGVEVYLTKDKKGSTMYTVQDDMFSHLRIVDIGGDTYVIMFFSELLKK